MKLLEDTETRLLIEDNPVVLGVILAIAIFLPLAIGLVMLASGSWFGLIALGIAVFLCIPFVVFLHRTRVILDRATGQVLIRTASLLGQNERTIPLAQVQGARVETSVSRSTCSNGGTPTVSETHRTVLQTTTGEVPLTDAYTAGDAAARMAQAINVWLAR